MTITYTIDASLYINITNRCTNRCDFCIRNYGDGVQGSDSLWLEREPSEDEVYSDIVKHDLSSYKEMVFCGYGEPLERLDTVVGIIRRIRKHSDIPVRINTNGQADLIYGSPTAKELEGLVDTISISLNAPDAQGYQKICHSEFGIGAFDAVIAYAADCKKYIKNVILSVVDTISPQDINKCREIADKLGVTLRVRTMID